MTRTGPVRPNANGNEHMELESNDKPHDSESIGQSPPETLNDLPSTSSRFVIVVLICIFVLGVVSATLHFSTRHGLIGDFTKDVVALLLVCVLVVPLLFRNRQLPRSRATQVCLYLFLGSAILNRILGLTDEVSSLDYVPIIGRTGLLHNAILYAFNTTGACAIIACVYFLLLSLEKSYTRLKGEAKKMKEEIADRKQAEEALRNANHLLEQTLAKLNETQEQVIQQERLRALGQMAGGVAHDMNNSLSPVLAYAEMIASAPDLPENLRGWAGFIETGARDAATVVERLREFYRPQTDETGHETVKLGDVMAQIPALTRPRWRDEAQRTGRNIEIELDLEGAPFVHGTPGELREVLTNLVFNAVDAMPSGGKITLRLRGETEFAVIEVTDTGIGMTDDVVNRCFEPFFTATSSEGTGLGLSVCHGIVHRIGGRFEIDTEPGRGTTMRIFWPLGVQHELPEPEKPISDPLPSRKVLYIDDDPRLRQLVSTLLEQLGQEVELADGGPTGLQMVRANDYDIVITDLGMPDIDGYEVTRIIKTTRQNMPVIMVTGWASPSPQVRIDVAVEPDQLVSKPLTLAKLREALEKAFA